MKGGDGEEAENVDAAAALPHAVAPVGALSMYSCGGAEERLGYDGDAAATFSHAVAPVGAPSAAAAWLENRAAARSSAGSANDQMTRRNSIARRATFDNWHLAAEQGSQMPWSVTTDVAS